MELDLVDGRNGVRLGGEALEMRDLEVRDADRPRATVGLELLERLPGRDEVAVVERRQRPVDQKQVDVLEAERRERLVERAAGVVGLMEAVVQLARDVDVTALEPACADRLADTVLVAVHLRRVDVAIAGVERVRHRLRRLGRRDLEHAEPELRNRVAVVQGRSGNGSHLAILPEPPRGGELEARLPSD